MIQDKRIVLTLDAGGTNFRFSAIRNGKIIANPVRLPAQANTLDEMLDKIVNGFQALIDQLNETPAAISFAFPGPADYEKGIIGDLENLPLFKGGVALGPFLQNHFKLPILINNDGDLFTLGEAIGGILPKINSELEKAGNPKRYRNLFGLTFGTGFGAGIVSKGKLFTGDNSAQAEVNRMRNHLIPETSVEDSVSIRAIKRVYVNEAKISIEQSPNPFEIYKIGLGQAAGNKKAALKAFESLGKAAANAAADAITLIDGIVVIGGGLSGAANLFMPYLCAEMNRTFTILSGDKLDRMEVKAYNLNDENEKAVFLKADLKQIPIPRSNKTIAYDNTKKIGVAISVLDTSEAIALGAYAFALQKLDAWSL
ncbi:MAG: ROK family protein [Bacteroidales bacterium]|jgi:glucokinase|nr:ROK family protein [Bacteroidales bacterium]